MQLMLVEKILHLHLVTDFNRLWGPELFSKTGHYFKKNCAYLISLCLHEQVGDMIVDAWPQFECNFNVFADMILPYGSHCIDMTTNLRTYQWRYRHVVAMLCDVWLAESSRASTLWRHDHNFDDQNMMVLPIVGGWLAMLTEENLPSNTMLMRWKVCKFKDEDLKILSRWGSSWNSAPSFQ